MPPLSDASRYWAPTSTPLSQVESTTNQPLALPPKCNLMVSWSLLVLPLLPLGQRGSLCVPPRPTRRRICVSCLSVSDRSSTQLQRLMRQLRRHVRTLLSFVIDFIHYFYVPTLPIKPSASSVR